VSRVWSGTVVPNVWSASRRPERSAFAPSVSRGRRHGRRAPAPVPGPRVLVVDDDPGLAETLPFALRSVEATGIELLAVDCGQHAVAIARSQALDLLILDLRLPDVSGLEIVRALQADGLSVPFLVCSAYLTPEAELEAQRLGAAAVVDKSEGIDVLTARVQAVLRAGRVRTAAAAPRPTGPASAAEEWARLVLRASESPHDVRTLDDWARTVGLSPSSLRERCRVLGVTAHDARDLARVLRARLRAHAAIDDPAALLQVGDERTLRRLLARAGLEPGRRSWPPLLVLIERQTLVPPTHTGIRALKQLLRLGP